MFGNALGCPIELCLCARVRKQRLPGCLDSEFCEGHAARTVTVYTVALIHPANRRGQKTVGQTGCVSQQMLHCHRLVGRDQRAGSILVDDVHFEISKFRDVTGYRIRDFDRALENPDSGTLRQNVQDELFEVGGDQCGT